MIAADLKKYSKLKHMPVECLNFGDWMLGKQDGITVDQKLNISSFQKMKLLFEAN